MSKLGIWFVLLFFLSGPGSLACTGGNGNGDGTGGSDGTYPDGTGGKGGTGSELRDRKAIIIVVDGLRPEMINETDTPNLASLAAGGTRFSNSRSVFPSVTMCVAGALATGSFPGKSSWLGAPIYAPHDDPDPGVNASGTSLDFDNPVDARDWAALKTVDNLYDGRLLTGGTLFSAAQEQGLTTAVLGKNGATFLQDIESGGILVDYSHVYPLELALELQAASHPVPANTSLRYEEGAITVDPDHLPPQAEQSGVVYMSDYLTTDPTSPEAGSAESVYLQYLTDLYTDYILPEKDPDISLIWYPDPDLTEHFYGPSQLGLSGLSAIDAMIEQIAAKVAQLGLADRTNFMVTADHGHSWVSGPLDLFPLRAIVPDDLYGCDDSASDWDACSEHDDCGLCAADGTTRCTDDEDCAEVGGDCDHTGGVQCVVKQTVSVVGEVDDDNGWSFSGWVSVADLLARGGFSHVYDGSPSCSLQPGHGGIFTDGSLLYPLQPADETCTGYDYSVKAFPLPPPDELPDDALIVINNTGSVLIFVPAEENSALIVGVVAYLQRLEQVGAIFVNSDHGDVPGTLPLSAVGLEFADSDRAPDIVFSLNHDETAVIQGVPGTAYTATSFLRGTHGSLSPIDMHTFMLGWGPDFRPGHIADTVAGVVDIAPTVAHLMGFEMPGSPDGRVLLEGLSFDGEEANEVESETHLITPSSPAEGVQVCTAASTDCSVLDEGKSSYTVELDVTDVTVGKDTYRYVNSARAVRQ